MSETIDILMELLNEYQESECALDEDRVTYYADRTDGRTEDERMDDERTKTEQNGVGITDELRKEARGFGRYVYTAPQADCLTAIADRIDEQHENIIYEYKREYEDFKSYRDIAYVKMPVDADGVPIHIGDVMEWSNGSFTVHELKLTEDGWQTWDSEHGYTVHADECIHHQPDTWERIIEDAANFALDTQHTAGRISLEPFVERCRRLDYGI